MNQESFFFVSQIDQQTDICTPRAPVRAKKLKALFTTLNEIKMFPFNSLFDKSSPLYSVFSWSALCLCDVCIVKESNKTATKINVLYC